MKITILRSSFQTDEFVREEYAELIQRLENECQAEITILGDGEPSDELPLPDAVMIATGGVENLFKSMISVEKAQQSSPQTSAVTLIADGRNNSLAAALEILTYLEGQGAKGRILHGSNEEIIQGLMGTAPTPVPKAANLLRGSRIGIFGKPSDWLIASDVDRDYLREQLGVETLDIDLQRVAEGIRKVAQTDAVKVSQRVVKRAKGIKEPTCGDMLEAAKVYLVLRQICKEERLDAMTIRCFDIVKACHTTSCLALALLNDAGIVAGCEGDLQTLLSMMLAKRLCNEEAFMANPSILTDDTTMFAHCTVPLKMCDGLTLRSHFESSQGVAIHGIMPTRYYTVFKWGGPRMDRCFVAEAEAVETPYSEHFCRTQLTLKLNMKPYLLNHPIGNHHVIIPGKHAEKLRVEG